MSLLYADQLGNAAQVYVVRLLDVSTAMVGLVEEMHFHSEQVALAVAEQWRERSQVRAGLERVDLFTDWISF